MLRQFNACIFKDVALTAQVQKQTTQIPETDIKAYPSCFDTCLRLTTICVMHNEQAHYLGFRATFAALFVYNH